MTWEIKPNGVDLISEQMQAAWRIGLRQGMEVLGVEGQRMVQDNIARPFEGKPAAVCTGNLLASIIPQVFEDQQLIRLIVGVGQSMQADQYAAAVETGARAHMPPASALVPWVIQKFGISDEKQALSVAFAVAHSIARRGTQGHYMFERAVPALEERAPVVLSNCIEQSMLRLQAGGA